MDYIGYIQSFEKLAEIPKVIPVPVLLGADK
jgi:hypothetical protein